MPYNIPLAKISTSEYKEHLKKQNLLPSRQILWEQIDANFNAIDEAGIGDLEALSKAIGNAKKIAVFAEASGVSAEYLNILRREMGSLKQKPVKIIDFPGLDSALTADLQNQGFVTSRDVFESEKALNPELTCLCDLVRINGVGAIAARMFYEAGYHSVKDISCGNAAEMQIRINAVNEKGQYYKASISEKDMQFCIDAATFLLKYT